MKVAFTTCALLKWPYDGDRTADFEALTFDVYRASDEAPGLLERADPVDDDDDVGDLHRDWGKWGRLELPAFYEGGRSDDTYRAAQTLSLWRDLASVTQFVFSGIHLSALRRRHEWFERPNRPTYAVWWVDEPHTPTWAEAAERLDLLARVGPTPESFDLKHAYDQGGSSVQIARVGVASTLPRGQA